MAENKTKPTTADVSAFIDAVDNDRRREDARAVDAIMREVTGEEPRMWGPSIIGYGDVHYDYETGRSGDWFKVGFSPRKAKLVLYFQSIDDVSPLLPGLGKHEPGKGCLYISKLSDIDLGVLRQMIATSVAGAKKA